MFITSYSLPSQISRINGGVLLKSIGNKPQNWCVYCWNGKSMISNFNNERANKLGVRLSEAVACVREQRKQRERFPIHQQKTKITTKNVLPPKLKQRHPDSPHLSGDIDYHLRFRTMINFKKEVKSSISNQSTTKRRVTSKIPT